MKGGTVKIKIKSKDPEKLQVKYGGKFYYTHLYVQPDLNIDPKTKF